MTLENKDWTINRESINEALIGIGLDEGELNLSERVTGSNGNKAYYGCYKEDRNFMLCFIDGRVSLSGRGQEVKDAVSRILGYGPKEIEENGTRYIAKW